MADEFIESQKGLIGVAGRGEGFEQRRRQLGQALARRGRAHRGKAPEMPTAHGLRDRLGWAKPRRSRVSSVSGSSSSPVNTRLPVFEERRGALSNDLS